jgi:hypothetical protein
MFTADARKPANRIMSKRPLGAEAERPPSCSILPIPFVGNILPGNTYISERGGYVYRKSFVKKVWAPQSRVSRRFGAKTKER